MKRTGNWLKESEERGLTLVPLTTAMLKSKSSAIFFRKTGARFSGSCSKINQPAADVPFAVFPWPIAAER